MRRLALRRAVAQSTCSIARSEVAHKESSNRANTALYQRFGFEMAAWLNQILNDPDARQFFATAVPSEPFPGTPASLVVYLKEDIPRWAEAYRLSKIEPQ
jgi:hypothetical protein